MPSPNDSIVTTVSPQRFSTYLMATSGDVSKALELYAWNARIAAALMVPTHFAEVAARNAVSEGLTAVYGPDWPWSSGFLRSLPNPPRGANTYNPTRDLTTTRQRHTTTGKVIADLKFVFWQKMFTSRHDSRVWRPHISRLFPQAPPMSTADLRLRIADDLEAIRQLRNRVAHHEPIFSRPLAADLSKMLDLVQIRCGATGAWLRSLEDASTVLTQRP